jgi:hypothetical protein
VPSWQDVKGDFEPDGAWRDVYVLGTDETDWWLFLEFVSEQRFKAQLTDGDGQVVPMPATFKAARDARGLLKFFIGDIQCNCHFFVPSDIEFDLDPRDVSSEAAFNGLMRVLTQLQKRIGKELIVTHESAVGTAFVRIS